ncbi:uncharacterized protein LOC144110799 [Amblyomma americanum]
MDAGASRGSTSQLRKPQPGVQLSEMCRTALPMHDCGARGDLMARNTASVSSWTQLHWKPEADAQDLNPAHVVIQLPTRHPRFEAPVPAVTFVCAVALFLYLDWELWACVWHHCALFISWSSEAHRAHRPLFTDRNKVACPTCMASTESYVNRSQDPCVIVHRGVCDRWNHHEPSFLPAAEDELCGFALNSKEWPAYDYNSEPATPLACSHNGAAVASFSVWHEKDVLVYSKGFLAAHHMPWGTTSRWNLLDASGNWNLHLWFQVTFDLPSAKGVLIMEQQERQLSSAI